MAFYVALFLICLFSGAAQGLTGFGFGIVAMSLLPLICGVKEAAPIVALLGTLGIIGSLRLYWKKIEWSECRGVLVGIFMGNFLGLLALDHLPKMLVMRLLGFTLLSICILEICIYKRRQMAFSKKAALPFGLLSGILGGAYNMGGPSILVYLRGRPLAPDQFVATLQISFALSMLFRSMVAGTMGLMTQPVLIAVALGLVPVIGGIYFGNHVRGYFSAATIRGILLVFLFLLALKYLFF